MNIKHFNNPISSLDDDDDDDDDGGYILFIKDRFK